MRSLGVVKDITHSGLLLVRAEFTPRVRNVVFDSRRRKVGTITKIFGPTRSPFVTIKATRKKGSLDLIGMELFLGD